MDEEYIEEYVEDYSEEYLNEIIGNNVNKYKKESYEYLNEIKLLVFTYLLLDMPFKDFNSKLTKVTKQYTITIQGLEERSTKRVDSKMEDINKNARVSINKPDIDKIQDLKFKLDKTTQVKARDIFIKRVKNYYKSTSKTLTKEYIIKDDYLSKKISQYDKVEKVVPYYSKKTGQIVGYHDIADYNSMVYNTNLTSEAWNKTLQECIDNENDLVYIPPHPFSCELCMDYQGRFYSLTGATKGYPLLESILFENGGGIKHPNCKHPIEMAKDQVETNDYRSEIWHERYNAKEKKRALELKKSRLKNDKEIYKKLDKQSEIDKINKKLHKINTEIKKQEELMKY